jgi:hypothetical protein
MLKFRAIALFAVLAASTSFAGENKFLGTVTVSGASLTNLTTAVPFKIPGGAYLTIVCDAAVRILTDNTSVAVSGANTGFPWAATTPLPTSVGSASANFNGSPSAVIAIIGTGNCQVWQRMGNE